VTAVVIDISDMTWDPADSESSDDQPERGAYGVALGVTPGLSLDWQADAECKSTSPHLFFPERGESTKEAKAICGRCPVKAQCLEFAIENFERFGIWGGTSELERRAIRRNRARARKIGGAA
jgi:WhiB family transcriptional regulator, redox-sensing transcriptional regulator